MGLLDPNIPELPKHRKKGIILVADSTFLITCFSTRGKKNNQGRWQFTDDSVAFTGKGHHAHKYPVVHKAHSVRTVNGVPMATLVTAANVSDQNAILCFQCTLQPGALSILLSKNAVEGLHRLAPTLRHFLSYRTFSLLVSVGLSPTG